MEEATHQKQNSKQIELYLKEEKRKYQQYLREPKLLLLGSSDSGKSTLLKQLKIKHGGGFTSEEKTFAKQEIKRNLFADVFCLLTKAETEGTLKDVYKVHQKYVTLRKFASEMNPQLSVLEEIVQEMELLWKEQWIQDQLTNFKCRLTSDNTSYFLSEPSRFCSSDYTPSDDDILKLRVVTQNISDNIFQMDSRKIHLIDVSGLKYHRMTWLQHFDNVHCVLFVISLSCYDQNMVEDETINRMADSIVLFEQISNHVLLKNSKLILFMNKRDVYEKKIKKVGLKDFFPEYDGKPNSASQGALFLKQKFLSQCPQGRVLHVHITCCTDTKAMGVIIDSVL